MPNLRLLSSLLNWLLSAAFLAWGLWSIGLFAFVHMHGTTPEERLTLAEGTPSNLVLSKNRYTQFLKFTVAGYHTEHSSDAPRFKEVLAAVKSGKPLRVWVSTQQETLFARNGRVPLYKLSAGDQHILDYSEVVSYKAKSRYLVLGGAVVFSAIGVWGLYFCVRRRRRDIRLESRS